VPRRLLAFAAVLGLLVRLSAEQAPAPASVTFAHFNDVYEIEAVEGGRSGGLARVATVVQRLRKTNAPVVTTLGGDFLSPSAISWARVDGEPLNARQMVAVLNAVGVDWATFGNHEFDLGETVLAARLAEAKFRMVSSNVTNGAGQPFPGVVPSGVMSVKAGGRTIRIGFIGVTLDMNRQPWVKYAPVIDAAKAAVASLRGKTDIIVALTHLSLAGDRALVDAVPEIDLVLGGHEHENWFMRRGPRFTPIVKADSNAQSLAVATLTLAGAGKAPTVAVRFENLNAAVPEDPRVQKEVRSWMSRGFDAFRRDGFNPDEVVGSIAEPLDGRAATIRSQPSTLTSLILSAMAKAAGTELGLLNGGSIRIDDIVSPGPVRQYDVMRVLPFGGKVVSAGLDGSVLASVLDAGLANSGSGGFLHWLGISRQDTTWMVLGAPLDPSGRYVVAMPEFLLSGLESRMAFLSRTNPGVRDVKEFKDIRMAVIDAIRSGRQ
jgi:5'-nucleotidase